MSSKSSFNEIDDGSIYAIYGKLEKRVNTFEKAVTKIISLLNEEKERSRLLKREILELREIINDAQRMAQDVYDYKQVMVKDTKARSLLQQQLVEMQNENKGVLEKLQTIPIRSSGKVRTLEDIEADRLRKEEARLRKEEERQRRLEEKQRNKEEREQRKFEEKLREKELAKEEFRDFKPKKLVGNHPFKNDPKYHEYVYYLKHAFYSVKYVDVYKYNMGNVWGVNEIRRELARNFGDYFYDTSLISTLSISTLMKESGYRYAMTNSVLVRNQNEEGEWEDVDIRPFAVKLKNYEI